MEAVVLVALVVYAVYRVTQYRKHRMDRVVREYKFRSWLRAWLPGMQAGY